MTPTADALVMVCCGDRQQIAALQASAAEPLARALDLPLHQGLSLSGQDSGIETQQALAALPLGCLVPLPLDPGVPLAQQGHWAEQLGAARRCCVLVLSAEQSASGLPAAATALLLQWRVPLLGLVQWEGPWDAHARSADGLPWLGWLAPTADPDATHNAAALAVATRLRWRQRQAELA